MYKFLPSQRWSQRSTRGRRRQRRPPSRSTTACRRPSPWTPEPGWNSRRGRQTWMRKLKWRNTSFHKPDGVSNKLASESKCKPRHGQSNHSVGKIQPLDPGIILQSFEDISNLDKILANEEQQCQSVRYSPFPSGGELCWACRNTKRRSQS